MSPAHHGDVLLGLVQARHGPVLPHALHEVRQHRHTTSILDRWVAACLERQVHTALVARERPFQIGQASGAWERHGLEERASEGEVEQALPEALAGQGSAPPERPALVAHLRHTAAAVQ